MNNNAERALLYRCSSCLTLLMAQDLNLVINISIVIHERTSLSRFSSSTSTCPSCLLLFLPPPALRELDNLIGMQNLRTSANKGSKHANDVHSSHTGYEPNVLTFSELNDSSVPFSYIIRSSEQDMDDVTLGKLHTEDKPIAANHKACQSVSRHCLSRPTERGNLWEKEMSISQLVLVSRETRTVLTASFLKTPKLRKWSIDQGNLMIEKSFLHRLGLYLKNRDR